MFRTTALDNKPNFLYVQGALAQKSNNDLAGLVLQNFDNDTKSTYNMASIVLQDHDGNSQQNGRGELIFKTSPGESILNEVVRITHAGFVGINTSNPIVNLHVRGSLYADVYCNLPLQSVSSNDSQYESLSNVVAGLSNSTSNLQTQFVSLSNSTMSLSNSTSNLQTQFVSLSNSTVSLSNSTVSLSNVVSSLSNSTSNLKTQFVSLSNSTVSLSNSTVSLSNVVSSLSNSTSNLQTQFVSLSNSTVSLSNSTSNLQSRFVSLSNSTVSLSNSTLGLSNQFAGLSNQFAGLSNATSNLIFRPSFTYFVNPSSLAFTASNPVNFVTVDSNLTTSPIVNQSGFRAPSSGKYFLNTNLRVISPTAQGTVPINIYLVKSLSSNPGTVSSSDSRVVATLGAPIIGTSSVANAATYSGDSTFTLNKLLYMESNSYVFLYFEGPNNCRSSPLSNNSEHCFSGFFAGYT